MMRLSPVVLAVLLAAGAPDLSAASEEPVSASPPEAAPVPVQRPEDDPRFAQFVTAFRVEALNEGIEPSVYDRAMGGVRPVTRVLELTQAQPEFVRQVWDYLMGAVSELRVSQGREMLETHRALFDGLEARYGVPREILTAIWGLESGYGRAMGGFNLFASLATLAYDGPRAGFGRSQLLAALRIAQREGMDPTTMTSSWAGAMGHTQFIPTTFLSQGVDGDGDGKRDIWNSPADALASAANYLRTAGWTPGQGWGQEVRLPDGFAYDLADPEFRKPEAEWAALGVRAITGEPLPGEGGEAAIFLPAGHRGPAFLIRGNFGAILEYNFATAYALAIGVLSDRLKGLPGVVASWPIDEQPLRGEERVALQEGLEALGFPTGSNDGVLGRRTRGAVRDYQKSRGLTPDGFATRELLTRIAAERSTVQP